jgi:hypothetical protein
MAMYEIEVTRLVEYKAFMQIEAVDENAAYDLVQPKVEAGEIALEQIYDHTEFSPFAYFGN